jgi:lipid A 3-O-deacylase
VRGAIRMQHCLLGCAVLLGCALALLALPTPARADEGYSPWRAFGLDELRLGGMVPNFEGRSGVPGVSFTPEKGVGVNGEVLFVSPWSQPENPIVDFLLRPRPMLGATVNTDGGTSLVYLGAAWSLPLFNILFIEGTFAGAYHDGPLTSTFPNYRSAYGCRLNFHESASAGVELGGNWRIMATIDHMSNGGLCEPNAGLTSYGARLGYKFNP